MKLFVKTMFVLVSAMVLFISPLMALDNGDRDIHVYGDNVLSIVTENGSLKVYDVLFSQDKNHNFHVSLIFVLNDEQSFPVTVSMDENENIQVQGSENLINSIQNSPEIAQQVQNQMGYYEKQYKSTKKSKLKCALGWAEVTWGIISHNWSRIISGIYNIVCGCFNQCI